MNSKIQPSKAELRRSLLKQRTSLSPEAWRTKSDRLCAHLRASPLLQHAQTVLAYISIRQEPDLSPLVEQGDHRWGFPRCVARSMTWHLWSAQTSLPMQAGAFGILEPHPGSPLLMPDEVDLILVPAIACSHQGYRLGYGGGFYDRMLSDPAWSEKPTIGITFEETRFSDLPIDAWDQPLHAVCTDAGLFLTPRC